MASPTAMKKTEGTYGTVPNGDKNKKSLVITFVTTYGVVGGKHKSIVHSEVTMDDLFQA